VDKISLTLTVNGRRHAVEVWPMARLLDVLREDLGLTGTKEGCGEGECGACSVLLDGELVNSCLVPALQAHHARITTIEGVHAEKLQRAFVEAGGAQCGICTPGMILAATALFAEVQEPNEGQIREWLAGNLCRCTGYTKIVEAVLRAGASAGGRA